MAGGRDGTGNGASGWNVLDVVEMINLQTMNSCIVNVKLDQPRTYHTGYGDLVCGGWDGTDNLNQPNLASCYNFVTGATINLNNKGYLRTSWSTDDGLYLLGGFDGSAYRLTELITGDSTQPGFTLKYNTT